MGYNALTRFLFEYSALLGNGVQENPLVAAPSCEARIQRRVVLVPAMREFPHECFVPVVERPGFPNPAERFRMATVPTLPAVLREDIPKAVELAVFGQ